ncbi:MAG: 4Fe-4S dicluster domain-containing protein [Candidatus Hodarchaeota archaeon]
MKKTSRRDFLKYTFAGMGTAVVGGSLLVGVTNGTFLTSSSTKSNKTVQNASMDHEKVPDDPYKHWGFLIDLSKCNGCVDQPVPEDDPTGEKPRCSYACRKDHYYLTADPPQYWIRVYELDEFAPSPYFFPKPCQNCENPPCLHVCPTGATYKRKDGTVLIDHKICIGCRLCMAACPYETRFFWFNKPPKEYVEDTPEYSPEHPIPYKKGTVVKCDLCVHKAYQGQLPACVPACPTGAIYYGNFNEDAVSNSHEVIPLYQTLLEKGGYRYKEEDGTRPSCYYLPPANQPRESIQRNVIITLEIHEPRNANETQTAHIVVTHKDGTPVTFTSVLLRRETQFGSLIMGKGKTDSDGYFSCSFQSLPQGKVIFVAELPETAQYKRASVTKHVV